MPGTEDFLNFVPRGKVQNKTRSTQSRYKRIWQTDLMYLFIKLTGFTDKILFKIVNVYI